MSIARATTHHELEPKIKATAQAGFEAIELFYEDIKLPSRRQTNITRPFQENLYSNARLFRKLCDQYGLKVIVFQPFKNYEGLLSKSRHEEKLAKAMVFFEICQILGADILLIPSMFHTSLEIATGGEKVVEDFRELADLAASYSPPIRLAYEYMAWGAHVDSWQTTWAVVQKVDRSNFGMCIDTYHTLAKVYGDPEALDGLRPNALESLKADLADLARMVDVQKIWYIQLSEAMKMDTPLSPSHPFFNSQQHPLMQWSRNGRVFPGDLELGGYMPVDEIVRTLVLEMGYQGWVSMESFHASTADPDPETPIRQAQKAMKLWKQLVASLETESKTGE
ncbi:hypothetical protein LTR84_004451 [Exophiala bonariae]|uniref:Xylose isomerase-like TIM barrel domain-containing protein n=1 Tax=Exophiala bonariae TaxID=1690606 RepID=A0AAV9N991_9EURO|nr:hypothetical protein LTR84_004451 [Exophiala bonariae]